MLIQKPADIRYSEVTPKSVYLNRRKFLAGVPAAFLGARELLSPSTDAQAGAKLPFAERVFAAEEQGLGVEVEGFQAVVAIVVPLARKADGGCGFAGAAKESKTEWRMRPRVGLRGEPDSSYIRVDKRTGVVRYDSESPIAARDLIEIERRRLRKNLKEYVGEPAEEPANP